MRPIPLTVLVLAAMSVLTPLSAQSAGGALVLAGAWSSGAKACAAQCGVAQDARAARQCLAACRGELWRCRKEAVYIAIGCYRGCAASPAPEARSECESSCIAGAVDTLQACRVVVAQAGPGAAEVPLLPAGRAADMSLLEAAERQVVEAADARAVRLRSRDVVVRVAGRRSLNLRLAQVRHGFTFGFTIDTTKFGGNQEDVAFYEAIARDQFGLAVLSNNAKWAKIERDGPGQRVYTNADADVEWATTHGFDVKGHTLFWGIVPPFSSSGIPEWVRVRFGVPPLYVVPRPLAPHEKEELRGLLRNHVTDMVLRYRDRVHIWDVTNETMQPLAKWFQLALDDEATGEDIVQDVFRWASEADPDATLVFNEWIDEVFTDLPLPGAPNAVTVRDRVKTLLDAGTPIGALGHQAHFTPAIAFLFPDLADLSQRTRLDDYAAVLDTLAETGLPIHVTEANFITPEDAEGRAAQAEGLLRIWWGHPSVEQIVFWSAWNKIAGRGEFDVGLWTDEGELSRHGEAVLSLLNDRWRTDVARRTGHRGAARIRAVHGDYVAEWLEDGQPVHASFTVDPGPGAARVVVLPPLDAH